MFVFFVDDHMQITTRAYWHGLGDGSGTGDEEKTSTTSRQQLHFLQVLLRGSVGPCSCKGGLHSGHLLFLFQRLSENPFRHKGGVKYLLFIGFSDGPTFVNSEFVYT